MERSELELKESTTKYNDAMLHAVKEISRITGAENYDEVRMAIHEAMEVAYICGRTAMKVMLRSHLGLD